jgi:hypothetical protein
MVDHSNQPDMPRAYQILALSIDSISFQRLPLDLRTLTYIKIIRHTDPQAWLGEFNEPKSSAHCALQHSEGHARSSVIKSNQARLGIGRCSLQHLHLTACTSLRVALGLH